MFIHVPILSHHSIQAISKKLLLIRSALPSHPLDLEGVHLLKGAPICFLIIVSSHGNLAQQATTQSLNVMAPAAASNTCMEVLARVCLSQHRPVTISAAAAPAGAAAATMPWPMLLPSLSS
jgi:hypothetical protein